MLKPLNAALLAWCAGLVVAGPAHAQSPTPAPTSSSGFHLRGLAGLANKQTLTGLQAGGEVFRQSADNESLEFSVGVFYGRMSGGSSSTCLSNACTHRDTFLEGTGLLLFNLEPGKRVRPFAGGGVTAGDHRGRLRYVTIAVAGGVNIGLGGRRAFRIDARLAENLAVMAGFCF